jgi:CHAT domain-containing protein/predicted metal-dependent hydrolase
MSTRYISFCLLLMIPGLSKAQDLNGDALRKAALGQDSEVVDSFVRSHRLGVKPIVLGMVADIAAAVRAHDDATIDELRDAIGFVAGVFESAHGERSFSLLAEQLRRWTAQDLVLKARGDSLLQAGIAVRGEDRPGAKALFDAALRVYQQIQDLHGIAEVTGQLGYVSWYLDRVSYIANNLIALEARKAVDDRQLMGNSLNDLGLGNRVITRDYEASLEYYLEGEAIRRAIGDSAALARMLPNIGRTYEAMGSYVRARDHYLEGAEFYLAEGDSANWIIQRRNTAGLMTNYAGRHTDALGLLLELRKDLETTKDPRAEALVRVTLGIVRRRLGDYTGAVTEYQEVVRLARENDHPDLLAQALNNIGVVYIFMARPDRAIPFFERAYAADSANADAPPTQTLLSLSSAHFQLRNYEEAEFWLGRASELASERAELATVVKMRSDIQTRTGREEMAKEGYRALLVLADELETPDLRSGAYFGLAEADERLDNAESALSYYELAAAELEQERGMLTAEEDKAGFLAQTRYLYEEIIHFLTQEAIEDPSSVFAARAFEFAERGKARAFLDQMAEALAGVSSGVDEEFQSDLDVLADNMAYLRGELATGDPADEERVAELKENVRQMEGEYERVEREMVERNPRFAAIRYPVPATLAEVQNDVLAEGELLLQYALGDSSSTLWAVSSQDVAVFQLPTRTEIESQVELFRFGLEDASRSVESPARQLYDLLVRPVRDRLSVASEIIVVPDGALNYVPFEALMADDGSYLVEGTPFSYAQSASVLRQLRLEPAATPTMELLAVGDPAFAGALETGFLRSEPLSRLPFSGAEASGIAALFSEGTADVLLAEEATEEAVTALLASQTYRFVHFATHGLVNDDRPDYSGLALAGSGTDALLQASEIFNLKIDADLVVLSACETGLGQLIKGEGMVGLTRAFMYAGTPSVAVSLWSVSDQSTSTLMQGLYGALQDPGSTKSAALRAAKLALLRDESTAHPFHWAPFILVGLND